MGMPNQTAQRLMYGYLRDGYRDVGLFPVDLCRGQVHQRALQYGALTRYSKASTRLLCSPTSASPDRELLIAAYRCLSRQPLACQDVIGILCH